MRAPCDTRLAWSDLVLEIGDPVGTGAERNRWPNPQSAVQPNTPITPKFRLPNCIRALTPGRFLHTLSQPVNMNKAQFSALNFVGGVCGLLILCDLVLAMLNGRLNQTVVETQSQFNQAQQIQNTAQNLVVRIVQTGQNEPALRALLAKHDFKVNMNTNNPTPPAK
jgi:hypothetical protein